MESSILGIMSPQKFIPVAEDSGLIVPIGKWVMKNACQQNKKWQQQGYPPKYIAVNLSVRQFQDSNLISSISSILDETNMDPQWLELEITESIAVSNFELVTATLKKFRKIGVTISLDDFGTGYSSFVYLKQLPIHTLKMDKSFLKDVDSDTYSSAIAQTVMSLAHLLHLTIIAEGVETAEQLNFLRKNSCHRAQGYLFSPPIPASEFEELLKKNTEFSQLTQNFNNT